MRTRPTYLIALSAAAAAALVLSGCHSGATNTSGAPTGSGSAAQQSASAPSSNNDLLAFAVTTESEATTALGADPGPGQESAAGPGVHTCIYGGVTGAGVRISLDESGVGKAIYDSTCSSYPAASRTDVPGVGDGAFEITTSDSQVTADLYKGGTFVAITLDTAAASGPPPVDQATALATAAAGRI